ncbi:hypothetical protein WA026_017490 [Henosepilachna vigintioctopunctata]|uniref:DNA-directed RNA polymerases I and III subunit RPAC1 n=1 Tax=Henosepilachna vigintioctopunctata TaxID=420089 RepID=A0AAW1V1C0_9CUCU
MGVPPTVTLEEHKISKNVSRCPTVLDEHWTFKTFKKRCRIAIVRYEDYEIEFDFIGIHPAVANTFRRIMISEVPTVAIEKVHVLNNTSIMQDEVLTHRLGLIPLKADPKLFEFKAEVDAEPREQDTLEFELKVKCMYNKDSNKNSSLAEDMYINNYVYSKHIKWKPIGSQKDKFSEENLGPVHDDILITKMIPGQELDLKLFAIKSNGKDHAKFSPVATAFYRMLPEISLVKEVEGEAAERLQKCFSPGVIGLKKDNGRVIAVVNDARYDFSSRNVYRYDDLKDAVVMRKVQDHFIFTIESVGAIKPDDIFREAINILKDKCTSLLQELNSL